MVTWYLAAIPVAGVQADQNLVETISHFRPAACSKYYCNQTENK